MKEQEKYQHNRPKTNSSPFSILNAPTSGSTSKERKKCYTPKKYKNLVLKILMPCLSSEKSTPAAYRLNYNL